MQLTLAQEGCSPLRAMLKQTWAWLTDDDIDLYDTGKKDEFFTRLQMKYLITRADAEACTYLLEKDCRYVH